MAAGGYSVHLIDPVPRLVAEAERRSRLAERPLTSCRIGDARALELAADTADIVLLLGPLYHLTEPSDRGQALRELKRVLKPGGWLFAAAISRYASALDGLARDLLDDPHFASSWSGICAMGSIAIQPTGWITSRLPIFIGPMSWRPKSRPLASC